MSIEACVCTGKNNPKPGMQALPSNVTAVKDGLCLQIVPKFSRNVLCIRFPKR